jgi:hypothetical protein
MQGKFRRRRDRSTAFKWIFVFQRVTLNLGAGTPLGCVCIMNPNDVTVIPCARCEAREFILHAVCETHLGDISQIIFAPLAGTFVLMPPLAARPPPPNQQCSRRRGNSALNILGPLSVIFERQYLPANLHTHSLSLARDLTSASNTALRATKKGTLKGTRL